MKPFCVFTLVFLTAGICSVAAQDLVFLRDGGMIEAKITEISPSEIRYKHFDRPDGPTFVIPAADVLTVRYENGAYEIINAEPAAVQESVQEEKADFSYKWFAGGGISANIRNEDTHNYNSTMELSPTLGFKVNKKFDMGLNPLFGYEQGSDYDYIGGYTLGIGIFARYSFFETGKFSILGRFGLDYSNSPYRPSQNYRDPEDIRINMFSVNISPVFQYNVLDNVTLYTSIGKIYYSWWRDDQDIGVRSEDFGFNLSLGDISLGFIILVGSSGNKNEKSANEIINAATEPEGDQEEKAGTTAVNPDKFTFAFNVNPAGSLIPGNAGMGGGSSVCLEFGRRNFNTEINLIFPSLAIGGGAGFGALVTFNGFWHSRIGGFYLGGGLGYIWKADGISREREVYDENQPGGYYRTETYTSDSHLITGGLNLGYKFVTKSGMYFRTGAYIGVGYDYGYVWGRVSFYGKPDLTVGYAFK